MTDQPNQPERSEPLKEKWRANYIPAPQYYLLDQACLLVNEAFGLYGCYLVGSALKTRDFRDVDVRLILPDEEFERMFTKYRSSPVGMNPFWSLLACSVSLYLQKQSGLPVDFQIQQASQANAEHPGQQRNRLGMFYNMRPSEPYPGGGV